MRPQVGFGMHHLRRAVAAALCMFSVTAADADFSCTVSVLGVLQYGGGQINVLHSGRGDWTHVCNVSEPRTVIRTVTPMACATWVALLLRAKKNGTPLTFWFAGTGSCATLATYDEAQVPTYIGEHP